LKLGGQAQDGVNMLTTSRSDSTSPLLLFWQESPQLNNSTEHNFQVRQHQPSPAILARINSGEQ